MEENHDREENEQEDSDDERRKGLDRRWIKSDYQGKERRKPDKRREEKPKRNGDFDPSRL